MLFGRGVGSVNRTDFVQHMLKKKIWKHLKNTSWKLDSVKEKKKEKKKRRKNHKNILKLLGESILKLVRI